MSPDLFFYQNLVSSTPKHISLYSVSNLATFFRAAAAAGVSLNFVIRSTP